MKWEFDFGLEYDIKFRIMQEISNNIFHIFIISDSHWSWLYWIFDSNIAVVALNSKFLKLCLEYEI